MTKVRTLSKNAAEPGPGCQEEHLALRAFPDPVLDSITLNVKHLADRFSVRLRCRQIEILHEPVTRRGIYSAVRARFRNMPAKINS